MLSLMMPGWRRSLALIGLALLVVIAVGNLIGGVRSASRIAAWPTTAGVVGEHFVTFSGVGTVEQMYVRYLDITVPEPAPLNPHPCGPCTMERTDLGEGTEVTVWYDPSSPRDFTLIGPRERAMESAGRVLVPAGLAVGAAFALWPPWRRSRSTDNG